MTHVLRCNNCFKPATHVRIDGNLEELCEPCARNRSEHDRGEAYAGLLILGGVVDALKCASLTEHEIVRAVREHFKRDDEAGIGDVVAADWQLGGFEHDDRFIPLGSDS